ncbi:HPt (histidine-containing phosphotransfer) domain-containing protein [Rhodoblastus acidophilus]|uniref:HPt (Histidine-containing phosphotransfer) domain-containing protein n=1 Tax=Rhodoblastus acidophilus TaxID=1074 RepID=A0A212RIB0_RHOAC|nr:Hpt domain-containing protein [Rhodoblastus acidophilus]MCW2317039.1 HPt (histidine-containing phosphotransfer) domain-containing protein [Rhodoblastus acidophilus]SNB72181.1 HPt (histidine-containing phosphotransfer) domain-containing protein [Rhodoblastus acidophilus]
MAVTAMSLAHDEQNRPPPSCPFDLVHLSRQTMGDRALEHEVLALFERQANHIGGKLTTLESGSDHSIRADLAHKLKGSARAVGAFAVAKAAENYEHSARAGLMRAMDSRQLQEALAEALGALRELNG